MPTSQPSFASLSHHIFKKGEKILIDALFPPRCVACPRFSQNTFCAACRPQLFPINAPFCQKCGKPFDPLAFAASECSDCRSTPSSLDFTRSVWIYGGAAREAIHKFKYARRHAVGAQLAPFLADKFVADTLLSNFAPDAITPVPLHSIRAHMRGFNQSEILARELAILVNFPFDSLLERVRLTMPQVELDHQTRRTNLRDAFAFKPSKTLPSLQGRHILLIDDVFTTGSTLVECARILKKAGASQVGALTLARQSSSQLPAAKAASFFEITNEV